MGMHHYVKELQDFFGQAWFDKEIHNFKKDSVSVPEDVIDSEQIRRELELHPLIYTLINYVGDAKSINFDRLPDDGTYQVLLHLGRDLELLAKEIRQRGTKIKDALLRPNEFNSYRFMLLVAAGYKMLGYKVEILPEKSHKTADLAVYKSPNQDYLVECKQRNQNMADCERYNQTAVLAEYLFPLFKANKITHLTLEVHSDVKLHDYLDLLKKIITVSIRCGRYEPVNLEAGRIRVLFFDTKTKGNLHQILENERNIRKVTYISRCEDAFVAADCVNCNVVQLDKDVKEEALITSLLEDANMKEKDRRKLVVYYDLGRAYSTWVEKATKTVFEERTKQNDCYPNIDCLFACQTMEKFIGGQIFFQPSFTCTAKVSSMGNNIETLDLLGFQGNTGMDSYFIGKDS